MTINLIANHNLINQQIKKVPNCVIFYNFSQYYVHIAHKTPLQGRGVASTSLSTLLEVF